MTSFWFLAKHNINLQILLIYLLANMLSFRNLFPCTCLHSYKYYIFTKCVVKTIFSFEMIAIFVIFTIKSSFNAYVLAHLAWYTVVHIFETKYHT